MIRTVRWPTPETDDDGQMRIRWVDRELTDEEWEQFCSNADSWWERVKENPGLVALMAQIEAGPEAFEAKR